jgi:hypothetical protein
MIGLLALAFNWPYGCIAIGILAAIAIGKKPCRRYFSSRPSPEMDSVSDQP